jgi:hypothetical protein
LRGMPSSFDLSNVKVPCTLAVSELFLISNINRHVEKLEHSPTT